MDIIKHGEPAYPVNSWIEEQYYSQKQEKKVGRRNSGMGKRFSCNEYLI